MHHKKIIGRVVGVTGERKNERKCKVLLRVQKIVGPTKSKQLAAIICATMAANNAYYCITQHENKGARSRDHLPSHPHHLSYCPAEGVTVASSRLFAALMVIFSPR